MTFRRVFSAAALFLSSLLPAQSTLSSAPARPALPQSPIVHADGTITFNLYAPAAGTVRLEGQLYPAIKKAAPGGGESGLPMTKDDKGVWSVTAGPLLPYFYQYNFVVDGVPALDPQNQHVAYGMNWLVVPGGAAGNFLYNGVPHGTVSLVWYASPTLGMPSRRMTVYTPPGYEDGTARYPVLYLLHGGNASEHTWWESGRLPEVLDNLIAQGKATPMIVVLPNGNETQTMTNAEADAPAARPGQGGGGPNQQGGSGQAGQRPSGPGGAGQPGGPASRPVSPRFPDSLVSDVIPFVDKHYRTRPDRESRAVVGLSLGSQQATYTEFHNVGTFAWFGFFGGDFAHIPDLGAEWGLKAYPLFATAGEPSRGTGESPTKVFERDGVAFTADVRPDNGSEGWRGGLMDFAAWVFKPGK